MPDQSTPGNRDAIRASLQPLLDEARERLLWLYCSYQFIWFSPDEAQAKFDEGLFLWDPVNWQLRDPREGLARLEAITRDAQAKTDSFKARMKEAA